MNQITTPTVCIQKTAYEDIDIKSLVQPLGGLPHYIKKGEKVLLKTNLLNATEPQKAVITHPLFIKKVAEFVLKIGAIPYIGDSPSGPFTKRRLEKVYQTSGLTKVSNEMGVELNYDTSSKKMSIPQGKVLKQTRICNFILDADTIISLPKLKTHSLMILTLATKIMFGAIPGLSKALFHSRYFKKPDFADMLLDILSLVPPNLILMDGIVGMQGDGPMSGTPVDLELIFASDESVALDLAVCHCLSLEPMGIPTLKQANIRKMWPETISYPLLSPEDVSYKDFELPSTAGPLLTGEKKSNKYPTMNKNCVACGECVEICPRNAIEIINKKAQVDYKKCIQCYCCHEVCRYHAINLESIK